MFSLAVPAAAAGWTAAGESPAAWASHALAVDLAVPQGPAPAQFALIADGKPQEVARRRGPYRALAAALACHLFLLALSILRPEAFWPSAPPERLGVEDGSLEVSVINAADLDRLHSDPLRREAVPSDQPPTETPPAPPPEPPPAPPPQEAKTEADPFFKPAESHAPKTEAYDPSGFAEMASQAFTMQVNNAFRMAEARQQQQQQRQQVAHRETLRAESRSGAISAMRPGASHKGRSDAFAKDVIWALAATKPMGNGKYGTVIVTFTVNDAGQLEGLRLIKSAGDKWLDQAVLMSVRQARMPKPPEPLPSGDRTFNVEYISQESR
jgi:periplasmic protein TonB